MKKGDIVELIKTSPHYTRGVVGHHYIIAQVTKVDIKLCTDNQHCFYTDPANVKVIVSKSKEHNNPPTPEFLDTLSGKGREFGKPDATDFICDKIDDTWGGIQDGTIRNATEETVDDLINYLHLLKLSM
jgi:hypothetical protein